MTDTIASKNLRVYEMKYG